MGDRSVKYGGEWLRGVFHEFGGGFVDDSCRVERNCWVGKEAMVVRGARLSRGSSVGCRAIVDGGRMEMCSLASGHAVVRGRVRGSVVSGWAVVDGDLCGRGYLRIGCVGEGELLRVGGALRGPVTLLERFGWLVEREFGCMSVEDRLALGRRRGLVCGEHAMERKIDLRSSGWRDRPRLGVGEACWLLRRRYGGGNSELGSGHRLVERGELEPWGLVRRWLERLCGELSGLEVDELLGCDGL